MKLHLPFECSFLMAAKQPVSQKKTPPVISSRYLYLSPYLYPYLYPEIASHCCLRSRSGERAELMQGQLTDSDVLAPIGISEGGKSRVVFSFNTNF